MGLLIFVKDFSVFYMYSLSQKSANVNSGLYTFITKDLTDHSAILLACVTDEEENLSYHLFMKAHFTNMRIGRIIYDKEQNVMIVGNKTSLVLIHFRSTFQCYQGFLLQ